ncbi:MAG TPA: class I SAM-dependent methyltransferase [Candidatus Paceibacterota bacterium]|nr:class I SAM-dependent methyltransferase [Candidatus Paceibacterota bacterium]
MRHTEANAKAYDEGAKAWDDAMADNVAHSLLEKPAMASLIPPDLEHKEILCIGVGAGEELASLVTQNPRRIVGIDVAPRLLEIAKGKYPSMETRVMDMMGLEFPENSFDFVYSSLVFHYAHDWDVLLAGVRRVMKPRGRLLFSAHHPGYWGTKPATGKKYTNGRGITLAEHTAVLPGDIRVIYYNHPDKESLLEDVAHSGLAIDRIVEPEMVKPRVRLSPAGREKYDSIAAKNARSPLFIVVLATNP